MTRPTKKEMNIRHCEDEQVTDWMEPYEIIPTFAWGPLSGIAYCEALRNHMNKTNGVLKKSVRVNSRHGYYCVTRSRGADVRLNVPK